MFKFKPHNPNTLESRTIRTLLETNKELLEALETFTDCFDENGYYIKTQANVKTALLDARAAIAKAKG